MTIGSPTEFDAVPTGGSAEVPVNDFIAAAEGTQVYARSPLTSAGLEFGFVGGRWGGFAVTADSFTLLGSSVYYMVVDKSDGSASVDTADTDWLDTANFAHVYKITTGASSVTALEDHRTGPYGVYGAATTAAVGDVAGPGSAVANDFVQFNGTTGKIIKDGGLALDTDTALAANSDAKVPSQKAVKAYADVIGGALVTHSTDTANPHAVTKTQVGLSAVPNIDATKRTLPVSFPDGLPDAGYVYFDFICTYDLVFPASLSGTAISADVAATSTYDLVLQDDGVDVATMRFAPAGSTAAVVGTPAGFTIAAGSRVRVIGTTPQDATLSNVFGGFHCTQG